MTETILQTLETPQGLILGIVAACMALELVVLLFVAAARRSARRTSSERLEPGSADPLKSPLPAKRRRSNAPIGLARLKEETEVWTAGLPSEPVLLEANAEEAPHDPVSAPPEPAFERTAPEPAAEPTAAPSPIDSGRILLTLPFEAKPGLRTAHAELLGCGVEAVFFDPEKMNALEDERLRLVPFLPASMGSLLARESDRQTFRAGPLTAQPDAVIELENGLIALEFKSKGGRLDDPLRWAEAFREKDLLQTVAAALVLSVQTGRPAAPILRTMNAVYFIRPHRDMLELLKRSVLPAERFMIEALAGAGKPGISVSDFATIVSPALTSRFPKPSSSAQLQGEAAHRAMLD